MWEGPSKVVATNVRKLFVDKGARLGTVNRDDSVRRGEEFWKISDKKLSDKQIEDRLAAVLKKVKSAENGPVALYSDSNSEEESEEDEIENTESEVEENIEGNESNLEEEDEEEEDVVFDEEVVSSDS